MTEQPPSAEALEIARRIRLGVAAFMRDSEGAREIDALIAQRVSAETERCARIADSFTCGGCGMDGKAGKAIRAPAERPAPEGPPRLMEGMRREELPDDHPLQSGPSALASTGEQPAPVWQPKVKKVAEGMFCNCGLSDIKDCKRGDKCKAEPVIYYDTMAAERPAPPKEITLPISDTNDLTTKSGLEEITPRSPPSPAAVVDYTERAREIAIKWVGPNATGAFEHPNFLERTDACAADIAAALSAVASEATIAVVHRDWAKAVAAGKEEKHAALLARLQEPDVREAVAKAIYDIDPIGVRDWSNAPASTREDCFACADAAITKIAEVLMP